MPHETITDEQLAVRMKNGDARAVSLIYERYKNGLFTFCLRLLGDRDTAEDAVHDSIVKMIASKDSLHSPASLKSWLFTIARNESFTVLHKRKNIRPLNDNDDEIFSEEHTTIDIEHNERSALIGTLLDRMLPQYKEVLLLREYEAMNYEEIAGVTQTTVSSVKSRLFKARKALMEKMEPYRKAGAL